jgi:hypothetical protein
VAAFPSVAHPGGIRVLVVPRHQNSYDLKCINFFVEMSFQLYMNLVGIITTFLHREFDDDLLLEFITPGVERLFIACVHFNVIYFTP